MTTQNDEGHQLALAGMATAVEAADDQNPGWSDAAYQMLLSYPHPIFQVEDVRAWAGEEGLADPPNQRAWGAIILRAKRHGYVVPLGWKSVSNPKAHRTPARLWKRVLNYQ